MKFQVVWLQAALNELTVAWMQADPLRRQAITAATHAVDQLLQTNPAQQGESRSNRQRIMFQPPLGITFEIDQTSRVVRVLHVWMVRQRGQP